MRNLRLTIQYDGTNYSGWQSQKNSIAIQDIIERAIKRVLGQDVRVIGAARTDAGVHARGQVANFKSKSNLALSNIKNGLNKNLPSDIIITKIEEVDRDFHARYDAKSKLYRYCLCTHNPPSPFYKNFVTPTFYKLDLDAINREAKALLGRHDFSSFQGAGSKRRSAVRNIYRIDVKKRGRVIYFDIEANGFLYNMARTIVGTLIDVGRGYLKKGSVKKILKKRNRHLASSTAPAKGLSLMKVKYSR